MNADEGIVEVSGSRWSNRRNATKAALEEVGEMLKRQRGIKIYLSMQLTSTVLNMKKLNPKLGWQ